MTASSDVIKEFLVGLNFKVDQDSLAKFKGGILGATASVVKVGAVATASALAVETMVKRVAYSMTNLYYATQMSGSSAENLSSLQYAFSRSGLSAEQATSAVKGLQMALLTNPGTEGFLRGLGVQTRTANNELRDTSDITMDLVGRLRKMPTALGINLAAMAGIGAEEFVMLSKNYDQIMKDRQENTGAMGAAGLDKTALTKLSKDYTRELTKLDRDLSITGDKLAVSLLPPLIHIVEYLDKALAALNHFGQGDSTIDHMVQMFERLNKATEGYAGLLGVTLLPLLGGWVAKVALTRFFLGGLMTTMAELTAATTAAGVATTAVAEGTEAAGVAAAAAAPATAAFLAPLVPFLVAAGAAYMLLHPSELGADDTTENRSAADVAKAVGNTHAYSTTPGGGQEVVPGTRDPRATNEYLMAEFQKLGWTKEQAAGLVGNAWAESNFDTHAESVKDKDGNSAHGLFQWRGKRWADMQAYAKAHGLDAYDVDAQIQFANQELTTTHSGAGASLRKAGTAADAGRVVGDDFEVFNGDDHVNWFQQRAEDMRREDFAARAMAGTLAPKVHNELKTDVTINAGNANAHEVKRLVKDAQGEAWENAAGAWSRGSGVVNGATPPQQGG